MMDNASGGEPRAEGRASASGSERSELLRVGDLMQSALSRVIEAYLHDGGASYEANMAALEGRSAIEDWTELRRMESSTTPVSEHDA